MSEQRIQQGDCRDLLANLSDASVAAVITDPPYEIGFMGAAWDDTGVAFDPLLWADILRVLKPGGHLAAFSAARTYHHLAMAVEDGGFEIRDQLLWLYGAGMPKGQNVGRLTGENEWKGWHTTLKGAHEPIVLARKPMKKSTAENVQEHGTGALNIDRLCRSGRRAGVPRLRIGGRISQDGRGTDQLVGRKAAWGR